MKRRIMLCLTLAATVAASFPVMADGAWPNRPVKLVNPYPPGGISDALSRHVAHLLEASLSQPVVVENKGGAGSNLGSDFVAKSAPDGYTLLMGSSANAINMTLYPKMPYDTMRDFVPISLLADVPNVLVVNPSVKAKTVKELIALAKAQPGLITYASAGAGSPAHLAAEELNRLAGIKLQHIPYKGAGPAIADVMAGHVSVMVTNYAAVAGGVQSGKLRLLGVGTTQRMPDLPEVPTIAEAGIPGYQFSAWYGLMAPTGTPKAVLDKLQSALAEVREPASLDAMRKLGVTPVVSTPEALRTRLQAELKSYARLVKDAGITVE